MRETLVKYLKKWDSDVHGDGIRTETPATGNGQSWLKLGVACDNDPTPVRTVLNGCWRRHYSTESDLNKIKRKYAVM
jgi:hypothetical protein